MKYLVVIALLCGVAHADDRATAEKYFRAGAKAYAAQSFEAAAAHFEQAYKALPLPEIAFSTAQAYRKLYRVDARPQYAKRAVELYRLYLEKVKKGGRVGDAADSLGEMERELARLGAQKVEAVNIAAVEKTRLGVNISIEGQAPSGGPSSSDRPSGGPSSSDRITAMREIADVTSSSLEGVAATLDGKPIEPFALIDVAAGDHVVAVTAAGYFPVEKKLRAVQGATALVEVELKPQPATVSVKTDSGARIAIDGRGVASPTFELPAGKHLLTIVRSGREPFGKELAVTRGQILKIDAPLEKTARRRAVPWVLGGAGVLAGVSITSIALAVVHDGRADDLHDQIARGNAEPATADAFDREVSQRDDYRTAAWVFGGAALVAGTVGFLLYATDSPSAEKVHITPLATTNGGGVAASGHF